MSPLDAVLRDVADILTRSDRRWALVGALAVSVRTEPRFTRDIDLAVAVLDDADAESVVRIFTAHGYTIFSTVEQDVMKRLATARLMEHPRSDRASVIVDLLFASSGIESEVVRESEVLSVLPGIHVPVARTGHLLALKVLSRDETRPQDAADIQALLRVLDSSERAHAIGAARLIAARGFARGKNLEAELTAFPGFSVD